MDYHLDLNDRPFRAIKAGTKKIEGRTPKDGDDKRYNKMAAGDVIIFLRTTSPMKNYRARYC
jgi:ASC-1-like (ASCH) protein